MQPLSVSAQTRLLVVAPHPDDETIGCGLLVQQVLAAGGMVRLLLLTDGDNNPWPQRFIERRLRIDDAARKRWGVRRRAEVMHAIAQLGVPASALHPLGWSDMGITNRLRDDAFGSMAAIRAQLQEFQPSVICCPALDDRHPDHGAAHVLCSLALSDMPSAPTLLAYPVHGEANTERYPILVEAAADQQQRKSRALEENQTQMALSGRRMRRLALGPERYMAADTAAGDLRLPWRPPSALGRWLRLMVATPAGVQDWRWIDAPIARDPDGTYRFTWPSGHPLPKPAFAKLHLDWPTPWIFDHWGWHAL
ncbi:PIG-L family deacetylase [Dyella psychrodurans]|uniref:PIG-L family deacetylase n=1 Tax=Dyella psychrodurans TaxID=1927960 RepID=A0A370XE68_9GAMM|nr:PIG-L family deacetylase [Dyella psychrodurans]RDS86511.1 PIG-L family deacetylase [Dyella psychrodurans]